jgi:hypothetical protein
MRPNAALFLAARRIRARPFTFLGVALAIGAAGALLGWSSLTAASAQEDSVQVRLAQLPPAQRAFRVTYFRLPLEPDNRAGPVAAAFARVAKLTRPPHRLRISHSIDPGNPLGTRVVVADDAAHDVLVRRGRLPRECTASRCEALALGRRAEVGRRVRLGRRLSALIVGVGSLRSGLLDDPTELGRRPLFLPSLSKRLAALVDLHGSTIVTTAELDPRRVHGYAVGNLAESLRVTVTRLERGDSLVRAAGPIGVLDDLARRGTIARQRLLVVAGEGAALIIAFAAFVAVARRRETQLLDEQLTTMGASRGQALAAHAGEVLLPAVLGTAVALGGSWVAAIAVAHHRGLPVEFARGALPLGMMLLIGAVGLAAALLLVVALTPDEPGRLGVGALETAALVALGLIVWQASTTGGLDPDRVARNGATPVVVLTPALVFFVSGVLLLRLVPSALRLGAGITRGAPFVRLTFVTAARNPSLVAAATTFLAVALGSALFSLNYRATIDRQARDQARFTVGADWRVRADEARLAGNRPAPVIRISGDVQNGFPEGSQRPVEVLALPASQVPHVLGWRSGFSALSRNQIAQRLRPHPISLGGPAIAPDAREIRVWARAQTDFPRGVVLDLLRPDQRFAQLSLGIVGRRWRLLRAPVPSALRGTRLVVVEYAATQVPISFNYDPEGFVDLGPMEQRRASGWSALPSIAAWNPTTAPDGTSGILFPTAFANAPVRSGVRFEVNGTRLPLVHVPAGLPNPLPGFQTGPLPALVSGPVARQAVDRLLTVDIAGKLVPISVVGKADLFPSIVDQPHGFLVIDYETLFAALNADQPGVLAPTEAWSFATDHPPGTTLGASTLERRLRDAPLAAGTRKVLTVAGIVAAALGFVGLVVATRAALGAERRMLAEYEALGVSPRVLRRTAQLRVVVLSALGIAAGIAGGAIGVVLIGAFVAVTGTAGRPLPPIASVVAWREGAVVLAALLCATVATAAFVARRVVREPAGRRLRA